MQNLVYNASPTLAQFHADDSFVRGVMGPVGSGKSTGMCMEIASRALRQAPSWDGMRRSRWAVIRATYPELKSTTIKTWVDWFREDWYGPVVYSTPIVHKVRLSKDTYLEVYFLALDRPEDIRKLLSLELTGGWINEARESAKEILDALTGRVGRYPSKREGGATWSGVLLDTNPPGDDHWWYDLAEENTPEGYRFWSQPSGLSPEAENIANLPDQYYQRLLAGKTKEWVQVYVHGQYGHTLDGKPVYEHDWRDEEHVAKFDMVPIPNREIVLGWDFGLTPACIIGQVTPFGQLRILDEVVGDNIGIEQFASGYVLPLLRTRYKDCPIVSVGDPSGVSKTPTDERTVFEVLDKLGIPTQPAPSNNPLKRIEAVRFWLNLQRGKLPGFQMNKRVKVLRRGFNGGYHYKRMQVAGSVARYQDKPDKNWASHPHDGLQYLCLQLAPDLKQTGGTPPPQLTFRPADAVAGF